MSINTNTESDKGSELSGSHVENLSKEDLELGAQALSSNSDIEKNLRRKFDLHILPLSIILYLCAFIDRSNMGNSRILGMEEDLQLEGYRFNIALTCFFITYIVFEIFANIMCKLIGPRIWLSFIATGFGLVTMCTAFVQSYGGLVAVRCILGALESGILPGLIFTLSRYYRRHEIATRIGWLSATTSLAGAFGGLLATAFHAIPKSGIIQNWRWVFLLEGIITICFGLLTFCILPDDPSSASFLSETEKLIAKQRLEQEQRTTGEDPVDITVVKKALLNVCTQLVSIGLICSLCVMNSIALFMPTLLHDMGFSSVRAQLMSVPPYVLGAIVCITFATISDRIKQRGIIIMILGPCIMIGFAVMANVETTGVKYFAVFLATAGGFCASPLLLSWGVENASGPSVKAVASAYSVGIGSLGALVSTWTYIPKEAPRYLSGHYLNFSFGALLFVVTTTLTFYLRWENKQKQSGRRDHILENAAPEERERLGHWHPEFRFTP